MDPSSTGYLLQQPWTDLPNNGDGDHASTFNYDLESISQDYSAIDSADVEEAANNGTSAQLGYNSEPLASFNFDYFALQGLNSFNGFTAY
jgi:hypothetical protein